MLFGIAFTQNGNLPSEVNPVIGWKQENDTDQVYASYSQALEANDLDGWRGYVCFYPSGDKVPRDFLP